jgi:glutaredoxin
MGVVLVTRKGCHLCDEALNLIRELGVEPELADIDADEHLFELYDWRVPVVLVGGHVAAEGRIDRDGMRKALTPGLKP